MADIHECPECHTYTITVQTRTQYFRSGNSLVKQRSCLPCWKDLLSIAEAMSAMNGEEV